MHKSAKWVRMLRSGSDVKSLVSLTQTVGFPIDVCAGRTRDCEPWASIFNPKVQRIVLQALIPRLVRRVEDGWVSRIGKVHEGSKRRNLGPMFNLLHPMTHFFERDADVSSSETNLSPYLTRNSTGSLGKHVKVLQGSFLLSWALFAVGSCSMFDCTNEACPFNEEVSRVSWLQES